MTKTLEFVFDFGGPNSYLAYRKLPELGSATGAAIIYVPVLLGGLFKITNNQAPLIRYADTPAKRNYEMLEFNRFVKTNMLPFVMNAHFPINSLHLMRGAIAAQRLDCFNPYVEAIMSAMWEDGRNTGDSDIVREILDRAGLDSSALLLKANDADVKAELIANTERAAARGAFGVPTFFVGEDMFWGKERLGQVSQALAS